MNAHSPKLDVPGIGSWIVDSNTGEIEFLGQAGYFTGLHGPLIKALGVPNRALFVDPQNRFIIVDAGDELLYGSADTGQLKPVATLNRIPDRGLRFGKFLVHKTPIFIYERGIVVLDSAGRLLWFRDQLHLDDHFKTVAGGRIVYASEHKGEWSYDISTGSETKPRK